MKKDMEICGNCKYCSIGMRSGKFIYSCIKVRGGKNEGFDFDLERMPVTMNRRACTFFKV